MTRITEILKGSWVDAKNDGELLGITQYPTEPDELYRERVAYAMQAKLYKSAGRTLSEKIIKRMEDLEITAKGYQS